MVQSESYGNKMDTKIAFESGFKCKKRSYSNVITAANWFLSKEGQTVIHTKSERTPDQTFRMDVTEMGKVSKLEMRKPGVEYVTLAHDPEILKEQLAALKWSRKLYQKLRGR